MTSTAHSITDIAEATIQPEPQRGQRLDALQADLTAMSNGSKIWSMMNPAIVIVPALLRSVEAQDRANAQLRVAATAVAVERYRIAHSTLPETLDALTPDLLPKVPLDPFDNQGLRYLRLDTGFTVYSVGVNAIDEKGAAPSNKDRRGGDIAIHVLR